MPVDQLVRESLVVPLTMVVSRELVKCATQVPFTERTIRSKHSSLTDLTNRSRNVRKLNPSYAAAVVVTEKSADTLAPANGTAGTLPWQMIDQLVAHPLVVSFAMVVRHELGEGSP